MAQATEPTRTKRGPKEFNGQPIRYVSVALTKSEEDLLSDWAWRLKTNRAQLMRDLIREGIRKYTDDLAADEKWPVPSPAPAPDPGG